MASSAATRIRLKSLMYVWYTHADIEKTDDFLTDFGLIKVEKKSDKIWYRGFGESPICYISEKSENGRPAFLGGGWSVDTYDDLQAAAQLPGASPISKADHVIGGDKVTLSDPAGGLVHLHWGHRERKIAKDEVPKKLTYNTWDTKSRKGEFQRFDDGPSDIHKLGHYGYEVNHADFEKVRQWYFDTLTLTATDSLFNPQNGKDIMTFMHLDKGEEYVDHHREPASPDNIAVWAPMLPLAFLTRNKEDIGKAPGPPPGAGGPPKSVSS
ncbi:uncharacterized protein N0V96_008241 [Colletotrichum fioriniae]|uniref:uncharacterized protein n=1 Tax=Colletotrichum fioriniae TaxID=710243 RepID=UPI0032DA0D1B|nr:hypothetical protein N0V96_008241 [Colletotrichum fioriniae]